ncbi:amino acid adenylation domain-containing protein [Amycolatopsis sp. NEAU-NG30]|uniref:Amino acid adenylation domain-containing protein n=1 Tax=Amycolatopsis melonis TaxID=3156488 RepID=A0ABV0LHN4_9PSEU
MRLSLGQERLWLLQQLDQSSAAYNIPIVLRFRDGIDHAALEEALDALVAAHPVLRWTFAVDDSGLPAATEVTGFRIPVTRRTAGPGEHDWQVHAGELAAQPFDLTAAPPVRAVAVDCADGSAVLCLVFHHIVIDGRSLQIVTENLISWYRSPAPPPTEVTYQEFVAAQRAAAGAETVAEHVEYWRKELDGFEQLELPTDRPRPAGPAFASDHVYFELPADLTAALNSFALRNRCALSSVMAAVFQALMSVQTGQEDVTIGTVLAGRDDRRFADVLGFFVNTVVLRSQITPSTSFRQLLKLAHAKVAAAYAHQKAPFEQVVAEVQPEREPGRNAIFDVVVVHNGELAVPSEGEVTLLPWAGVNTRFDLELVTHLQGGKLYGTLTFRAALFHRSTVERLAHRFVRLVEQGLENPDEPLFGALREPLEYWRQQLTGAPAVLDLPTDRVRPPVPSGPGDSLAFTVDSEVAVRLRELSGRHGVTLFTTLLAAYTVVLSRYGRTDDVTVGVPAETGGNTLVLRTGLAGEPAFPELLARVHETTLGGYAHQDVPFERLVAELAPRRDFSRRPLAQAAFRLGPRPDDDADAEPFDLDLRMTDRPDALEARLHYRADLFGRVTIERFAEHFRQLLGAVAADADRPLSALPMMGEAEARWLAETWNDTAKTLPEPATVTAMFAGQAARRPQATALVCGDTSLTYAELDRRSNRLAHRLRGRGAGPGTVVGVCLPRSVDLVTALLAVLKTGAAYLPIDPEYPEERRRLLLTESEARLVVTPELTGDPALGDEPETAVGQPVDARDLAYVIYTSGSTGRPKGVEIEHRAIARLVTGLPDGILGPGEVVLHASAISFDAATFEVWGALLTGATCVVSTERVLTARPLADVITRHRISTMWLTSSLFNHIVDEDTGALAGVRNLLVGGEALSVGHVRRAVAALPETRFFNGYGPTECTTFATCHPITGPVPADATGIPIGRPIGNTRGYVLDGHGRLTPAGVPGELHVAGPGVARGYRGQPELTAAQFVHSSGDRLYRTGDIVRHNADGDLEYLGRVDDQVKIRGYRIEPREVEAALRTHPDVAQAAVVARESAPGQKTLVGYVTLAGGAKFAEHALRAHLRARLPEYLVPAAFVALPELPLTPNGKLDVRALPEPGGSTRATPAEGPRNATEEALAAIWAEVLGLDSVGRDDSFFDVGGHSLKAAQLAVRIQAAFRTKLPLRALFERPTIAKLAEELDSGQASTPSARSFDPVAALRGIVPGPLPPRSPGGVSDVLLTGATGFVGAYLVRELLARTGGRVHCLVRAADEPTAWDRLRANLDRYGLGDEVDLERVAVVPGDLAAPGLGLPAEVFGRLAAGIDLICHNGARVDALSSYEQLEGANVGGTRELIRLAVTTRLKPVQFVSTISAAGDRDGRTGYAESKAHAEQLVTAAYEQGVPSAIYRLPRIVGDSRTGQGNTRDIMLRVLRTIIELGAAPDTELAEPWIAVDETAGLLARLGVEWPSDGHRFVLTSRQPVRLAHLVELVRGTGTPLDTLPVADWLALLETRLPEEHAILKLLFDSPPGDAVAWPDDGFTPIVAPGPDDRALLRYVDKMLRRPVSS